MHLLLFFAHSGEVHRSAADSLWHNLENWRMGVPFFIVLMPAFSIILFTMAKRSVHITLFIVSSILLLLGLLAVGNTQIFSTVAFTAGWTLLLGNAAHLLMRRPDRPTAAAPPTTPSASPTGTATKAPDAPVKPPKKERT
jgi:hypothetical protein